MGQAAAELAGVGDLGIQLVTALRHFRGAKARASSTLEQLLRDNQREKEGSGNQDENGAGVG